MFSHRQEKISQLLAAGTVAPECLLGAFEGIAKPVRIEWLEEIIEGDESRSRMPALASGSSSTINARIFANLASPRSSSPRSGCCDGRTE